MGLDYDLKLRCFLLIPPHSIFRHSSFELSRRTPDSEVAQSLCRENTSFRKSMPAIATATLAIAVSVSVE